MATHKIRYALLAPLVLLLVALTACGSASAPADAPASSDTVSRESIEKPGDTMTKDSMEKSGEAMAIPMNVLVLDFSGIEPLANGFHY